MSHHHNHIHEMMELEEFYAALVKDKEKTIKSLESLMATDLERYTKAGNDLVEAKRLLQIAMVRLYESGVDVLAGQINDFLKPTE